MLQERILQFEAREVGGGGGREGNGAQYEGLIRR